MEVAAYQYLIIAGVPKAATSSLFSYLAEHPAICGGYIKETCFFLDPDYPSAKLPLRADYLYTDGLESFSKYYRECTDDRKIRLDATPDYLYSPGTARRLAESLPNSKVVFVLREPIARLISFYGFAIQRGKLAQNVSFDEYVELLRTGGLKETYPVDALGHGRYACFLPAYYEAFGMDRIRVFLYEELLQDPKTVTQSVCKFIGISPEFFENYHFGVHNKTRSLRYPKVNAAFIRLRHLLRRLTYKTRVHRYFQRARLAVEKNLFEFIRDRSPQRTKVSDATRRFLVDYYYGNSRQDLVELERLIGRQVSWTAESASGAQSRTAPR